MYYILGKLSEGEIEGSVLSEEEIKSCLGEHIYAIKQGVYIEEAKKHKHLTIPQEELDHKPFWRFKIEDFVDNLQETMERKVLESLSAKKLDRYSVKYKRALSGDVEFFKKEASMMKIAPRELIARVKEKGDKWIALKEGHISTLEAVRVGAIAFINKSVSGKDCYTLYANLVKAETKDLEKVIKDGV